MQRSNAQNGFTLVELAVVLLLIGLIVGGVLRGRELVTSAQINAIQTDANRIRTATRSFQDRYQALPGDLREIGFLNASALDDPPKPGNRDGRILCDGQTDPPDCRLGEPKDEAVQFWVHLGVSGFLETQANAINNEGINGDNVYRTAFDAAVTVKHGITTQDFLPNFDRLNEPLIMIGTANDLSAQANDKPVFDSRDTARLDRKVDDGQATSGQMLGGSSRSNSCRDSNTASGYASDGTCAVVFRF